MSQRDAAKRDALADVNYQGNAFRRMFGYLKPYRKAVTCSVLIVLAITALQLYRPILIGDAIDRYILGQYMPGEQVRERLAGVAIAAIKYASVLIALFVFSRMQFKIMQRTGQSIVYDMRNQIFSHVAAMDMRFFDTTPVGKIVTRVTNDTESINEFYADILVKLFRNIIKIIGYIVVMLCIDVRMALLSFILLPVIAALIILFRTMARRAYQAFKTRLTKLNMFLSQNISGMRITQIFRRERQKYREFAGKSDTLLQSGLKVMKVNAFFRPIVYFLSIVALAIVLNGGSEAVLQQSITIGTMYVFVQYIQSIFEPIQQFSEQLTALQSAVASAEKIFTLLDTKPVVNDPAQPKKINGIKGRIEFSHVWFAYENKNGGDVNADSTIEPNWILKDVSFVIEPGQKVAFVGATGAGKSSVLNLIGRYYDIQKGSITIDGIDIRDLDREELRRNIGQVQQDVFIFTGDIRENISLKDDIPQQKIEQAAEYTNAAKFIERLPSGYDEHVGQRGMTFSTGQRQLLSFARTLAHDPRILILDEATANIDTQTEQWIQQAMENLMRDRTTIMVAHRLSTIRHADQIVVMHHGRIRQTGTHQELLAQNGIYSKLYHLQLAD